MAKSRKKSGLGGPVAGQRTPPAEASDSGLAVLPQSAGDTTTANVDRERIAQRAYELYLARGGADGQDMEDWFTAERELVGSYPRSGQER
jgi:hypothetical protein